MSSSSSSSSSSSLQEKLETAIQAFNQKQDSLQQLNADLLQIKGSIETLQELIKEESDSLETSNG